LAREPKKKSGQKVRQEKRREESTGPRLTVIEPKSINQQKYFESIEKNAYTFVIGPPGTGKTFIALWHGLKYVLDPNHPIKRIAVVRPLVEVNNFDEKTLGALPGDAKEKMTPWMGAMMDSMKGILPEFLINQALGSIDYYNIALCRGRSFTDTFIIVDESQNITVEGDGMKMLLTRLGAGSKMIIAGDLKQADIGTRKGSALKDAIQKFYETPGFGTCILSPCDIVRHELLSTILEKYGDYDKNEPPLTMKDILEN